MRYMEDEQEQKWVGGIVEAGGFLIRDANENGDAEQQFSSRGNGSNTLQFVVSFKPAP